MSVINKMLRDLDQRQAPDGTSQAMPDKPLLRGTASLAVVAKPAANGAFPRYAYRAALAVLLLVLSAGGFWWWQQTHPAGAAPVSVAAKVAAPDAVSVITPASVAIPASKTLVPTATSTAPVPATTLSVSVAAAPTNPRIPAQPSAVVKAPSAPAPLQATAGTAAPSPVKVLATPPVGSSAPASTLESTDPQAHAARQLQAGSEALAQAQSLWAAGSHDAATELLQQALTLAERSGGSGSAASVQLLSPLVRELGRMQLADGRAASTLDLLTRLEPVLSRDADTWALRGNAAQRLGRHQDSVRAYAAALQLRPNEQRWLLGSAVSLAALGQTARASEMANKARGLGPISKEVLAYLRQAGVQISEP